MQGRWVWGGYVLSVAWVSLLFVQVDRFIHTARTETFRQEGRRLVSLWADRIADVRDPQQANALVRRFSGEIDSRAVALLDEGGQTLRCVGAPLPSPPRLPLSDLFDRSLDSETWAYWAPLWVSGRREGYVVWVQDASRLKRDRSHTQRGLLAAGVLWATVGSIGAVFAARRH